MRETETECECDQGRPATLRLALTETDDGSPLTEATLCVECVLDFVQIDSAFGDATARFLLERSKEPGLRLRDC